LYFWFGLSALALLGLCQGGEPATVRSAAKSTNAKAAATARLYGQHCERCHEADGKGRETEMPDFTSVAWQKSRTDEQFYVSILDGKKRMPGFRKKITEEQARDLVVFVRAFAHGDASAADFSSRFRQLQDELADLQRQFQELTEPSRRPEKR
jgi:mono/diheme cytochrome c family protein